MPVAPNTTVVVIPEVAIGVIVLEVIDAVSRQVQTVLMILVAPAARLLNADFLAS